MVKLKEITGFLDNELKIADFRDDSNNGLQVSNSGQVRNICVGVDASLEFFEMAAEKKAGLLICHHGISWNDSLKRITGMNYNRLKFLMDHDMALYAAHLPLDAHPRLGNNIQICRKLGLKSVKPFGDYHGMTIGFKGSLPKRVSLERFKDLVSSSVGKVTGYMDFGKPDVRSVVVVSGGGASVMTDAAESGADVFLTGEAGLSAYHVSREYGINAVLAGHYATEVFGVKAVASLLEKRFRVKAIFVDTKVPF